MGAIYRAGVAPAAVVPDGSGYTLRADFKERFTPTPNYSDKAALDFELMDRHAEDTPRIAIVTAADSLQETKITVVGFTQRSGIAHILTPEEIARITAFLPKEKPVAIAADDSSGNFRPAL